MQYHLPQLPYDALCSKLMSTCIARTTVSLSRASILPHIRVCGVTKGMLRVHLCTGEEETAVREKKC